MQSQEMGMDVSPTLLATMIEEYAKRRGQLELQQTIKIKNVELEDDSLTILLDIMTPWQH